MYNRFIERLIIGKKYRKFKTQIASMRLWFLFIHPYPKLNLGLTQDAPSALD
jgi:hypothetical protein